jgi:hypothetical protein
MKGLGRSIAFERKPTMTGKPSPRSHLLQVPPPFSSAKLGTKHTTHGPLGDTAHPNHSATEVMQLFIWQCDLKIP